MKIDEAIRVNTVLKGAPVLKNDTLVVEALNLSIEALKFRRELEEEDPDIELEPLPGETGD